MRISIIVPIFKVEPYLDECITSLVSQTYRNLEIILVDDGSPDNCPTMCDQWALRDSRIRVIHKKNGGLSDARNAGLSVSTGEYIMFIDSDDFVDNVMVEKLLDIAISHNADVAACSIKKFKDGHSFVFRNYLKKEFTVYNGIEGIEAMLYEKIDCAAWNKLYRKSSIEGYEFPVGRYNEDVIFHFYSWQNMNKIVYTKEAYYNYRVTENSLTHSFSDRRKDYMKNAFEIKEQIESHIPSLCGAGAFYLNVCASNTLMDLWYAHKIGAYKDYFQMCQAVVRKNYYEILKSPRYNMKSKIKSAVMSLVPWRFFSWINR